MKSKEIIDDIIGKIISGDIPANSKMPSETQLSIKYDCNRHTIRKVVEHLIERNYLLKSYSGITYVMDITEYDNYNFFIGSLSDRHKENEIKTIVHKFELLNPSESICDHLNIDSESKTWHIIRIRYVNSTLDHIEEIYMPYSIFSNLTIKDCESSLLNYIESQYDFKISHGIRNISAITLGDEESRLLDLPSNTMVMQITNTGYLTNGRVYEYSLSKTRENKLTYYCRR
ncbi:GntR family transcriptional regulator [Clostridium manihotivorum]|uniref:GntR family transcriptional regulator n=1 Tax=Clostridium manihotivorum TaxID=2320868 RepID=A0A410DU62_9CLOT|nr:GntR family transcriptional regulator [Clostridium manihotivorum]QAA32538.1 GntR family transcriptional regulator [Clostridium manihotivorum]